MHLPAVPPRRVLLHALRISAGIARNEPMKKIYASFDDEGRFLDESAPLEAKRGENPSPLLLVEILLRSFFRFCLT